MCVGHTGYEKNLYLWKPKSSSVGRDIHFEREMGRGVLIPTRFHFAHTPGHVLTGYSGALNPYTT